MKRVNKYLIYAVGLPSIGFLSMYLLRPITSGAHDGGFLGMVFGLSIGQIIFACWLIGRRWYYDILIGLVSACITIYFSFWTISKLRDYYNPIRDGFFREPDEALENKLQWLFFLILIGCSIMVFEIVFRMLGSEREKAVEAER